MIESYPLCWPDGWKRTPSNERAYAQFGKREAQQYNPDGSKKYWRRLLDVTIADGLRRLLAELDRMGIDRDDVIISTNVPLRLDGLPKSNAGEPGDPGAAVYWRNDGKSQMKCMAIDRYTRVADNLAALAATLEAMRAIERHGGAEILDRAFRGFAALPEHASQPWRKVFGFTDVELISRELLKQTFQRLALARHPDHGGSDEQIRELLAAREQAEREIGA